MTKMEAKSRRRKKQRKRKKDKGEKKERRKSRKEGKEEKRRGQDNDSWCSILSNADDSDGITSKTYLNVSILCSEERSVVTEDLGHREVIDWALM